MGPLNDHAPTRRVESIDALRGTVMILMALDHVRDFIHRGAMTYLPTDLTRATPALFLTRWVTHICAPAFMFTAGLAAFLWWHRGKSRSQLSVFLLTRGLWLAVLEVTVMRLGYNFNLSLHYPLLLLVLWALGASMIVLAGLVWLPFRALAVLSVALIALHNGLDGMNPAQPGSAAGLWNLLHQPGAFSLAGWTVIVGYPLVPWVGVMALGFCCGRLFTGEPPVRQRYLAVGGVAATIAFVVLRALNGYGDPQPWAAQGTLAYTVLSFLNTTKYPPSLAFLLMTLGPAALLLAWFDRPGRSLPRPLVVYGRVPLFYFVVHFFAAHAVAVFLAIARYGGGALNFIFHPLPSMGGPRELFPEQFGYDLWVAYLMWVVLVVALYPICRWFAALKARRHDWWLSYF